MIKIHMPTAEGYTRRCDSKESQVQVDKVAGATQGNRRCDNGESLVRLDTVTGATETSRWCDFVEKTAHLSRVDADVCSSSTHKQEFEMSSETFKTIDNLVRKWSLAFNLDDHHAHKLRDMLERRARRLMSAYERGRCGNFDAYIAVGLSKYAARDAARCKDQMSLHAEVSLDEPVNGEEADGDTRLDFVADEGLAAVRNRRKRDVWEVAALLPRPYRRICEWIMAGRTEAQIAARLGVHRTSYKRTVFPKVRAAFIRLYGTED